MGTFAKVSKSAFDEFQLDAGVLLKTFDPESPTLDDSAIICATSGGISVSCVPTYSDFGEDVDNCPTNTKELKHLDSWETKMSFTALNVTESIIKLSLGSADSEANKVTPRADISKTDFSDLWWVGDRSDGGMVAVCLKNALATAGLTLQTTKNGKGTIAVELTGHVSIDAQDEVPMEFYVKAKQE